MSKRKAHDWSTHHNRLRREHPRKKQTRDHHHGSHAFLLPAYELTGERYPTVDATKIPAGLTVAAVSLGYAVTLYDTPRSKIAFPDYPIPPGIRVGSQRAGQLTNRQPYQEVTAHWPIAYQEPPPGEGWVDHMIGSPNPRRFGFFSTPVRPFYPGAFEHNLAAVILSVGIPELGVDPGERPFDSIERLELDRHPPLAQVTASVYRKADTTVFVGTLDRVKDEGEYDRTWVLAFGGTEYDQEVANETLSQPGAFFGMPVDLESARPYAAVGFDAGPVSPETRAVMAELAARWVLTSMLETAELG